MRRLSVVIVSFAVLFATSAFKPEVPARERNAILISWDGALREHVHRDLLQKRLPNLARLVAEGALVDIDVTGHTTDTKAGHAQLLTGYDPDLTGVYSNRKFGAIPRGLTIFERLRQSFGPDGITTIMLTGKDHNLGSNGPSLLGSAEPFHLARQGITVWDGDRLRPASEVGARALAYIDEFAPKGRFFLFVHFPDIDANGHGHGEASPEYEGAMRECDAWLGKILDATKRDGIDDRTLVYVTADHGFEVGGNNHAYAPHIFLASNDRSLKRPGQQRDIAPTVLTAMGVDLATIRPPLPGKTLAP